MRFPLALTLTVLMAAFSGCAGTAKTAIPAGPVVVKELPFEDPFMVSSNQDGRLSEVNMRGIIPAGQSIKIVPVSAAAVSVALPAGYTLSPAGRGTTVICPLPSVPNLCSYVSGAPEACQKVVAPIEFRGKINLTLFCAARGGVIWTNFTDNLEQFQVPPGMPL